MALGLSFSLDSIPGASSAFSQLDNIKADFLAVPAKVNASKSKLALIKQYLALNGSGQDANRAALQVSNHLDAVQAEWQQSADSLQAIEKSQAAGGDIFSLDTITSAVSLATNATKVLNDAGSLDDSVNQLAQQYLTPAQIQAVNAGQPTQSKVGAVGLSIGAIAVIGLAAFFLLRRRGR